MKKILSLFTILSLNCFTQATTNIWDNDIEKELIIVSASRNNKKYYAQNLESTLNQNYTNYKIIWIDDASPDGTGLLVEHFLEKHPKKSHVQLVKNITRQGAMANFYNAIYSCKDDSIILMVDGDDFLAHPNVLKIINHAYQDPNVWLTYGNFVTTSPTGWKCHAVPQDIITHNQFRSFPFVTSHVKTFYAGLFKKIKKESLLYKNEFIPVCSDFGMMIPMLEMAGTHIKFIDEVLYIYNIETNFNEFKTENTLGDECCAHVRQSPQYAALQTKPF